jgi:SH3 domain-containing protein
MRRNLFGCVLAVFLLLGAHSGFAQTSPTAARTIQSSVLVQEPRADSNVVAAVPPGVVIQVFARSGDWYQARTMESVPRTGWIHRSVIELLSPEAGAALLPNGDALASQGQHSSATSSPLPEPDFSAGHAELVVEGGIAGWNATGETVGVFQLDSLVGFVASRHFEVVVSTSVLKASGVDAFGTFGGGLFVNFRDNGPIVPFAGGVIGKGFGASSLFKGLVDDPTFVNVSGGFRVLTRGGGGALIVRPFYERYFNSSDVLPVSDVNRFGISLGASILF